MTFWQHFQTLHIALSQVFLWLAIGMLFLTRTISRLRPEQRAVLKIRMMKYPKLFGALDVLSGIGWNWIQIARGLRTIARVSGSTAAETAIEVVFDDDAITLTPPPPAIPFVPPSRPAPLPIPPIRPPQGSGIHSGVTPEEETAAPTKGS